jgi:hypothetical protein
MIAGFHTFRGGLSCAARYPWVLAVAVAVSLLSALLAVTPASLALLGPAHRPAISDVIDGVDAWMILDALSTPPVEEGVTAFSGNHAQQLVLLALLTLGLLLALTWLSSAFLTGGTLRAYAEGGKFRWRRFLHNCWRWFGTLLLLSGLQAIGTLLVFGPLVALAVGAISTVGGWVTWAVVSPLSIMALLWLALIELTRVAAVVGERRNVLRASWRGVRFVLRRPLHVGALYGASVLSWGVVYLLYRWGLEPRLPRSWWLLAFVLQQAFGAVRLWIRLGRWAGSVALHVGAEQSGAGMEPRL